MVMAMDITTARGLLMQSLLLMLTMVMAMLMVMDMDTMGWIPSCPPWILWISSLIYSILLRIEDLAL